MGNYLFKNGYEPYFLSSLGVLASLTGSYKTPIKINVKNVEFNFSDWLQCGAIFGNLELGYWLIVGPFQEGEESPHQSQYRFYRGAFFDFPSK